ncbi:hypothetical protein WJX84_001145 [Apatococcus fuscideae]|uniref:Starch synthase catalytic domain-containing protein n=1 Tax=Apatococcus fuscideae TaxID=2026836 RepID=A0AAW1SM48_9CHLO
MLTTEDPQGLNDEIARLQRENQLMQQLLAGQSQTAEDNTEKVPGQASAEEEAAESTASARGGSVDNDNGPMPATAAGTSTRVPSETDGTSEAMSGSPSASQNQPNSPVQTASSGSVAQTPASAAGKSAVASQGRQAAGGPVSQSPAPQQTEEPVSSAEVPDPINPAQPARPTSVPSVTEDEATSQQYEQAKADMAKRKRRRVPPQAEKPMDIVFVSAEAAPWSKTGGLGDVVGSLPIALADRGHRVMVVVPRYLNGKEDHKYAAAKKLETRVGLNMGSTGFHEVDFYHQHDNQVDWVFVDHPVYQRAGNPYADEHGAFGDNVFRPVSEGCA